MEAMEEQNIKHSLKQLKHLGNSRMRFLLFQYNIQMEYIYYLLHL